MDIKKAVGSVLKELIVPELNKIKDENKEIKTTLVLTNKRLDDINLHLADQSRRIDSVREELGGKIDETNKRIDRLYEVIVRRDEHSSLDQRVVKLEFALNNLKRMAA